MKKLIFIILLSVLVIGCGTKKKITHTERTDSISEKRDSIRTEYIERVRDTTIYLSGDSALISALLECDSLGQVQIKTIIDLETGLRIRPNIEIVNNVITLKCTQEDSIAISVYWKDVYEKKYEVHIANISIDKEVTDEKLVVRSPWYLRFWWIWAILLGVGFIAYKFVAKKVSIR